MDLKTYENHLASKYPAGTADSRLAEIHRLHHFLSQKGIHNINEAPDEALLEYAYEIGKSHSETGEIYHKVYAILEEYANFMGYENLARIMFFFNDAPRLMVQFSEKIREKYGCKTRDKIFENMERPEIYWDIGRRAAFTIQMERRCLEFIGKGEYEQICESIGHGWQPSWHKGVREKFLELGSIEGLCDYFNTDFMETMKSHYKSGQLFYTQKIDGEVLDFLQTYDTYEVSGNQIIITKMPFNTKGYLNAGSLQEKQYHFCHCPWARQSIKGDEKVSPSFCYCSLGHAKAPFDVAYGQTLSGKVIESVLEPEGTLCKFSITIPDR